MPRYPREHTPKLNRYSRTFARLLFQRFPQWKELAGTYSVGEPGLQETLLKLQLLPPNPRLETPLRVRTTAVPQEILISWMDGWHRHLSQWPGHEEPPHFHHAIEVLERIVTEQDVVCNVYQEGRSIRGGTLPREGELPKWALPEPGQLLVIRSWLGTYDREVSGP